MSELDRATIDRARLGDELAWRLVHANLAPRLLGYFRVRGIRDAEDLCADVLLEVARSLVRFDGDERAFKAWVFTIAHSRYVDLVRAIERDQSVSHAELPEVMGPDDVEAAALSTMEREDLLGVINALTDRQRSVVLLRVFADLDVAETARVLGVSDVVVKVTLHRAIRSLQRRIASTGGAGVGSRLPRTGTEGV